LLSSLPWRRISLVRSLGSVRRGFLDFPPEVAAHFCGGWALWEAVLALVEEFALSARQGCQNPVLWRQGWT
jgi:hypothetical protein